MTLRDELRALRFDKSARNVRVLTIDIETRPMLLYSFGLFNQFHHIEHILEHDGLLCFSAKWLGEKKTMFYRGPGMVQAAHDLLTEADIVVTYNGWKFDVPHLNNEFVLEGMAPPAPFKHVDLIKTNKQRFAFPSRKLDYLAGRLIDANKDSTDFQLWLDCMADKASAWKRMEAYNRKDVALTEQLYLELLPWLVDQPHIGIMSRDDNQRRCAFCGSANLTLTQKPRYAYVRMYELHQCDACGGWNHMTGAIGANHFTRGAK